MKLKVLILPLFAISFSFANPCSSPSGDPGRTEAPDPSLPSLEVKTVSPQFMDIPEISRTGGTLAPAQKQQITSNQIGVIEKFLVTPSQTIKAGDPLVAFQKTEEETLLQQKEEELKMLQGQLEADKQKLQVEFSPVAETPKSDDPVFLDEDPAPSPIPPKQNKEYDLQKKAQLEEQIKTNEAKVTALTQEIEKLNEVLSQKTILAPVGGVIEKINKQEGESVSANDPLLEIKALDTLSVSVKVSQEFSLFIDKNIPVEISPLDKPDKTFKATIDKIAATPDPLTKTLEVSLLVLNPEAQLQEGMEVQAILHTRKVRREMTLPESSLQNEAGQAFLWMVENGKVRRKNITTGETLSSGQIIVTGDLHVDDFFVVNAPEGMVEGAFVQAIP